MTWVAEANPRAVFLDWPGTSRGNRSGSPYLTPESLREGSLGHPLPGDPQIDSTESFEVLAAMSLCLDLCRPRLVDYKV